MDISFLLRGLIIGFSIAAPVGPIGVLCIRRTLAEGRASGLVSGLGAATADAIYAALLDSDLRSFQASWSVNKYGSALSAVRFSAIWASRPSWPGLLNKRPQPKGMASLARMPQRFS